MPDKATTPPTRLNQNTETVVIGNSNSSSSSSNCTSTSGNDVDDDNNNDVRLNRGPSTDLELATGKLNSVWGLPPPFSTVLYA